MSYAPTTATSADITNLYGTRYLAWASDRDLDGAADSAAVTVALATTASYVARKIGKRYALPLPSAPADVIRMQVDLTVELLAGHDAGALSDEHKRRADAARHELDEIASGCSGLGLVDDEPPTLFQPAIGVPSDTARMLDPVQTEGLC